MSTPTSSFQGEAISEERDRDLVIHLRHHDPSALMELHKLYYPLLYLLIIKIVWDPRAAEDLVQETIFRAWRGASQLDPGASSAGAWLVSIARNRAVYFLGLRRFLQTFPLARFDAQTLYAIGSADPPLLSKEPSIDWKERGAIELDFYEGLSPMEVAPESREPLVTVKDWARLALSELKQRLDPIPPYPPVKEVKPAGLTRQKSVGANVDPDQRGVD